MLGIFIFLLFAFYPLAGTSCLGHFYALYKTDPVQDKLHLISREITKESTLGYQSVKNLIKQAMGKKTPTPQSPGVDKKQATIRHIQATQQEDELSETDRAFLNHIIKEKTQQQNHQTAAQTP